MPLHCTQQLGALGRRILFLSITKEIELKNNLILQLAMCDKTEVLIRVISVRGGSSVCSIMMELQYKCTFAME